MKRILSLGMALMLLSCSPDLADSRYRGNPGGDLNETRK